MGKKEDWHFSPIDSSNLKITVICLLFLFASILPKALKPLGLCMKWPNNKHKINSKEKPIKYETNYISPFKSNPKIKYLFRTLLPDFVSRAKAQKAIYPGIPTAMENVI